MKALKKLMIVMTLLLATTAFVACGGDPTTQGTTQTTVEQTTATSTQSTSESGEPYFTGLFTEQTYYIGSYDYDMLAGVTAMDQEDGDITDDIRLIVGYSSARAGKYEVYVAVTDSDGNTASELVTLKVKELTDLGFKNVGNQYFPDEIFGEDIAFSLKGFLILLISGVLVGFGTRYAGGCTSGHAITGLSSLQLPSLLAVIGFFIGGIIATWFIIPLLF